MNLLKAEFADGDNAFDTDSLFSAGLWTSGTSGYPSDVMLAFSQPPNFQAGRVDGDMMHTLGFQARMGMNPYSTAPSMSNIGWADNETYFATAPARQWPGNDSGLAVQTGFAEPSAFQSQSLSEVNSPETNYSAQSFHETNGFGDEMDGVDAKPHSPRKRSIDAVDGSSPKKGRSGRKGRASKSQSSQSDVKPEDDNEKREKFLERNRLAASKCRQKKKEWTSQLEERARELTNDRHVLTATVAMLKNELLELKCKCLEHSNCECGLIQDYLKKAMAEISPTKGVYALDRRPSEESTQSSAVDEGVGLLATSRRSSLSVDPSLSSPKTGPDIDAKVRSTLRDSLGSFGGGQQSLSK